MIGFGIPQGMEMVIILAVVLLLFGHRLPGMARSLGSGITEFKRGLKDGSSKSKSKDDADSGEVPSSGDTANSKSDPSSGSR